VQWRRKSARAGDARRAEPSRRKVARDELSAENKRRARQRERQPGAKDGAMPVIVHCRHAEPAPYAMILCHAVSERHAVCHVVS